MSVLTLALKRKESMKASRQKMSGFRQALEDAAATRHSLLHPPRRSYVYLFYLICLLLLVAETGLSMTIIHDYMDTHHSWSNTMYSYAYAIGMASAFAILFKLLIEKTLFTVKNNRYRYFIFALIVAYAVLVILFSHVYRSKEHDYFKGIILAFFSILFALGNAFMFREAVYLHHLYLKLNGNESVLGLKKKRQRYSDKWESIRLEKLAEAEALKAEVQLYKQLIERIRAMIANLKAIAINSLLKGYNDRFKDIIDNNEELNFALRAKIKKFF